MKDSRDEKTSKTAVNLFPLGYWILAIAAAFALFATFLTASSGFSMRVRVEIFLTIAISFFLILFGFYFFQSRRSVEFNFGKNEENKNALDEEIEEELFAFAEAEQFFGASLKLADMFRLVSNRINEIVPFAAAALFLPSENSANLKTVSATAAALLNLEINSHKGLAGKTFVSQMTQTDEKLLFDRNVIADEALSNFKSAVCLPLWKNSDVFGVLQFFGDEKRRFDEKTVELLEAISARVAPLFLSSLAFEKSLSNALTDATTNLPNERAFFLVLENQIAEAQRFREERPLSILSVDIKGFSALNEKFGHIVGDRILAFAADTIKTQLRQMDFLSRSKDDEFLVALPTATAQIAHEISLRLEKAFAGKPFVLQDGAEIFLELNCGAASVWTDGEIVQDLLDAARFKKKQKRFDPEKIIRFPQKFTN